VHAEIDDNDFGFERFVHAGSTVEFLVTDGDEITLERRDAGPGTATLYSSNNCAGKDEIIVQIDSSDNNYIDYHGKTLRSVWLAADTSAWFYLNWWPFVAYYAVEGHGGCLYLDHHLFG